MVSLFVAFLLALVASANAMPMEDVPLGEEPGFPLELSPGYNKESLTYEAPYEMPASVTTGVTDVIDDNIDYDPEYYDYNYDYESDASFSVVDEKEEELESSSTSENEVEDPNPCELRAVCEPILEKEQEKGYDGHQMNNFILNPDSSTKGNVEYSDVIIRKCAEALAKCSLYGSGGP